MTKSLFSIEGTTPVSSGKFLALEIVHFRDDRGRLRNWEAARRVNGTGAVLVIATIVPENEVLLVRQFRPPAGKFMIEFPAGLIDPGESVETTAIRELYEETGYAGKILHVFPPAVNSPGMSGESITIVQMEIDGIAYPEAPESHQEDSEGIETIRVPRENLRQFLQESVERGDGIDAKLISYLL